MSFLTVEDVNTVNLNHINEFHEIDTSKISLQEFENVLYDFVICNHTISGAEHTFTFEIHNSLWSRLYHVANANDVVLVAGKGHEDYQILADRTIHFDDREKVKDIFIGE